MAWFGQHIYHDLSFLLDYLYYEKLSEGFVEPAENIEGHTEVEHIEAEHTEAGTLEQMDLLVNKC